MKNKIVGFTISIDILVDENLNKEELYSLLCDMENEISNNLEYKFNCKIIGGNGRFLYIDKKNNLIK